MSQPLGEERRVVPFAVPRGRARRPLAETLGDSRGAILLFTGVRYERLDRETGAGRVAGPSNSAGSRRGR